MRWGVVLPTRYLPPCSLVFCVMYKRGAIESYREVKKHGEDPNTALAFVHIVEFNEGELAVRQDLQRDSWRAGLSAEGGASSKLRKSPSHGLTRYGGAVVHPNLR